MSSFVESVQKAVDTASTAVSQAKAAVGRIVGPYGGDFLVRALHDIYSKELEGLDRLTKAMIANLRFISFIPAIDGLFSDCIKALEAQKDLYYATKFWGSSSKFIGTDKEGNKFFQIPRVKGEIDWVAILYAIGDYLEVGKFCQKYKIYSFPTLSNLASEYGAVKVFDTRLDDIPVFGTIFDRPKDLCIFLASSIECWKFIKAPALDLERILKVVTSMGKMLLITFGKYNYNTFYFAVIDVITQNASLISVVYKEYVARNKRFDNP